MTRVATNAIDYGDTATSISGRFHQSAGMVTMCISLCTPNVHQIAHACCRWVTDCLIVHTR